MESEERLKVGNRVSLLTIAGNILLSGFKIAAGCLGGSGAVIADGIHSLSDVAGTVVVIIGINLAEKPGDECHPYGHEKLEPLVTLVIATILLATALGIGYSGFCSLRSGEFQVPGIITLYAAAVSIVIKEVMYRYTVKRANTIDSSALRADAWHHRSDVLTSVGTLLAVLGARLGYRFLDPLAAIVICILIGKVAVEIYIQSINRIVDHAGDEQTVERLKECILAVDRVLGISDLKTRLHGCRLFVDVEIEVDRELSVLQGHKIAERVHDEIEERFTEVKHCMVHVEPYLENKERHNYY
ncbi:MAG: cation diffusion facilitator family transporter [Halanaerobiales bacterium]